MNNIIPLNIHRRKATATLVMLSMLFVFFPTSASASIAPRPTYDNSATLHAILSLSFDSCIDLYQLPVATGETKPSDIVFEKFLEDPEAERLQQYVLNQARAFVDITGDYDARFTPYWKRRKDNEYQIGINIDEEGDSLIIAMVHDDSPAQRAGLKRNDIIVSIDRKPTRGLPSEEFGQLLLGPLNSEIVMQVQRGPRIISKKMKRQKVVVQEISVLVQSRIPVLRFYEFEETTLKQARELLKVSSNVSSGGIILDFRGNGGGTVRAFVDGIASSILPKGSLVFSMRSLSSKPCHTITKQEPVVPPSVPIVILIDRYSSSGTEVLVEALRKRKGVTVMGEPTRGQFSRFEQLYTFEDNSMLIFRIGTFLTADDKERREGKGIQPDILVPSQLITNNRIISKAIEFLRNNPKRRTTP